MNINYFKIVSIVDTLLFLLISFYVIVASYENLILKSNNRFEILSPKSDSILEKIYSSVPRGTLQLYYGKEEDDLNLHNKNSYTFRLFHINEYEEDEEIIYINDDGNRHLMSEIASQAHSSLRKIFLDGNKVMILNNRGKLLHIKITDCLVNVVTEEITKGGRLILSTGKKREASDFLGYEILQESIAHTFFGNNPYQPLFFNKKGIDAALFLYVSMLISEIIIYYCSPKMRFKPKIF